MYNRVLIVDDDPGIRETISQIIEELGYNPDTAADGLEALAMLDTGSYLCVFTDIMMPKMTGIELIKKIKARDVSLPIIVITGYASLEIAIDAMKCGASDFISKPFKVSQIQLLLSKVNEKNSCLRRTKNSPMPCSSTALLTTLQASWKIKIRSLLLSRPYQKR